MRRLQFDDRVFRDSLRGAMKGYSHDIRCHMMKAIGAVRHSVFMRESIYAALRWERWE